MPVTKFQVGLSMNSAALFERATLGPRLLCAARTTNEPNKRRVLCNQHVKCNQLLRVPRGNSKDQVLIYMNLYRFMWICIVILVYADLS
jgi:hypothetical protein